MGNAVDTTTFVNRGITHGIATTIPSKVVKNTNTTNTTLLYSSTTVDSDTDTEEDTPNE